MFLFRQDGTLFRFSENQESLRCAELKSNVLSYEKEHNVPFLIIDTTSLNEGDLLFMENRQKNPKRKEALNHVNQVQEIA